MRCRGYLGRRRHRCYSRPDRALEGLRRNLQHRPHQGEISIYDPALLVKQMTNSPSEIVLVPYEEGCEAGFEDMLRRVPDISKIQQLIGYRPVLDLPEMLERVIAYERDREK
jgi:nucleoside-diphosphate-sugar epimerase